MGGAPQPEPDSAPRAGHFTAHPLAADEISTDIIEGGGPPRRRLPRRFVLGLYAVCGIVALVWVGVTVLDRVGDPVATESATLTLVGNPQVLYRPGHADLVVTLRNHLDATIFIDDVTVVASGPLEGGSRAPPTSPAWTRARLVPSSAILTNPDPAFWPNTTPSNLFLARHGGEAVLVVTMNPSCVAKNLPDAAQVAVSYHNGSDQFREVIPDLLNTGSTDLPTMVNSACTSDRLKPTSPHGPVSPIGPNLMTVGGVALSFSVPPPASWDEFNTGDWSRYGSNYISKSTGGGQGAEAVAYATSFPGGGWADLCPGLLSRSIGRSATDLAAAVSTAPGTHLVTGPTNVTVGGHPAKHVVLTVRKDLGCDPGYFYSWRFVMGGSFWATTDTGDTISVWIVELEGKRLFIAGETKKLGGHKLKQQIQKIIESVRFN